VNVSSDCQMLTFARKEYDWLRSLQRQKRWDWPAAFSTNPRGDIWPYVRHGWTQGHEREEVSGLSAVIDKVTEIYRKVRSDGGRFFIDEQLACYKGGAVGDEATVFVVFQIVD
jgi:hypothetical protein